MLRVKVSLQSSRLFTCNDMRKHGSDVSIPPRSALMVATPICGNTRIMAMHLKSCNNTDNDSGALGSDWIPREIPMATFHGLSATHPALLQAVPGPVQCTSNTATSLQTTHSKALDAQFLWAVVLNRWSFQSAENAKLRALFKMLDPALKPPNCE
jgi:hypothetical protein